MARSVDVGTVALAAMLAACASAPPVETKLSTVLLLDPHPAAQVPLIGAACVVNTGAARIGFRSGDTIALPRQGQPAVVRCSGARWDALREVRPIVRQIKDGARRSSRMAFGDYLAGMGAEYPDTIVLLVGTSITGKEAERLTDCEGLSPTVQVTLKCRGVPIK